MLIKINCYNMLLVQFVFLYYFFSQIMSMLLHSRKCMRKICSGWTIITYHFICTQYILQAYIYMLKCMIEVGEC
jgi:hypothetical protein